MSKDDDDRSPWLRGVAGVRGVVPPGRRLSKDKRPSRWSASGVKGVVPPGNQKPGEGPVAEWLKDKGKAKRQAEKLNARALEAEKKAAERGKPSEGVEFDPMRPMAGFVPEVFADIGDPGDLKVFLQTINDFLTENRPDPTVAIHFNQVVNQSHAPFEIVVGFTVLSVLVGRSSELRRRFALSLERGAKAFFNLAGRLRTDVKPPRGLVPETVDAIFYDLPATAYQVPYAFATDAFVRLLELLRKDDDPEYDATLLEFARGLRERFIEGRSFGDTPLVRMFPDEVPEW
ncbi:MAG: hypothetical protein KC933_20945 [Myxococcales bacterium]|nr:hypothetical protein [Myxococcales bacterium]